MNRRKRQREAIAEINVVPYVDVMLVLLVIFMITTPLLIQGVEVELPRSDAAALPERERPPLVVTVDQEGRLFLNVADDPTEPMVERALRLRVAAELKRDPGRPVLVKGDLNAHYGQVVAAMVVLQQSGAPQVGLMTDPKRAA